MNTCPQKRKVWFSSQVEGSFYYPVSGFRFLRARALSVLAGGHMQLKTATAKEESRYRTNWQFRGLKACKFGSSPLNENT